MRTATLLLWSGFSALMALGAMLLGAVPRQMRSREMVRQKAVTINLNDSYEQVSMYPVWRVIGVRPGEGAVWWLGPRPWGLAGLCPKEGNTNP